MSNQNPEPSNPTRPQSVGEQEIRSLLLRLHEMLATRIVEILRQQTPSEAGELARTSSHRGGKRKNER